MYKKDTKSEEMFLYIFWIVPNSWHFATNPGNVYQDTKLIGNVPITLFEMLGNVPITLFEMLGNVPITLFKMYQIHQITLLIPEMYLKDTKLISK